MVNQIKTTTDAIVDRREKARERRGGGEAKMEQNHMARENCSVCVCVHAGAQEAKRGHWIP